MGMTRNINVIPAQAGIAQVQRKQKRWLEICFAFINLKETQLHGYDEIFKQDVSYAKFKG